MEPGLSTRRAVEERRRSPGGSRSHHVRVRFSTRRRLILAFSGVLAAFLAALAFQFAGLRRMEATFAEMKDHEEQTAIAFRLEDAAREQYAHEFRFLVDGSGDLAPYLEARARVVDLGRALAARLDEPETIGRLRKIRETTAALDRTFQAEIAPAVRRGDPSARDAIEARYPLVSDIERTADLIVGSLNDVDSVARRQLADLERGAVRAAAVLLVGAPLIVAAAVIYLSRSVAGPLARLGERAAANARGALVTRPAVDSPDEFDTLAADLDAMAAALMEQQRRLVESEKVAGIGRLAAGVAHELNNPLQVMLGYLSLNRNVSDPRLAQQLAAVEHETLRCKEIVDGLLELSRPSAEASRVELRAIADDAAGRVRVSVKPGPSRISVDGAGVALADPDKVGQVLFNLLKNAAEAAGPGGEVSVAIAPSVDAVQVAVRDSGPGIGADARSRLFEPFFTTKAAGKGLGLAVSRAIARAHGGDIDFGAGDAGGAVFTLRLPRAPEVTT